MRRTQRMALAVVGAITVLTAAPVTAQAATPPVVNWAHSVTGDLGTLEVGARAEAGVTSLRAHIRAYGAAEDVAVVEDFVLTSGTVHNGVWRTPSPVQLPELGYYQVVVDVTDADGVVASGPSYGSLSYVIDTAFSPLRADPPSVTHTDREVTVSGTLTGTRPDNRAIVPVPGVDVWVSSIAAEGQPTAVSTDEHGSFAASLVMTGPGEVYADADPGVPYNSAHSDAVSVGVTPAESRVTITPSATEVEQGQSVTVSGQLTWLSPDSGWQPLAGKQVGVMYCADAMGYCQSHEYPITDAQGRYSATMTPWHTGHFQVGFPSDDPFIGQASARADFTVWEPASFADFTAVRETRDAVVAQGHMLFGSTTPWPVEVQIQFRRHNADPWRTVATDGDADWDGTGYHFTATVPQRGKGQWRAHFAGRPDLFRPISSASVLVR